MGRPVHTGSGAEASAKGPFFPLGNDGPENTATQATATCFCGGVQLAFVSEQCFPFPTENERLIGPADKT